MKIAIIGGSGVMGRWLGRFLKEEGKEITLIGRSEPKVAQAADELGVAYSTDIKDIEKADVVIISVPINHFKSVVSSLSPHTHPEQIIMDITSVKVKPVATMHRHIKKGRILGTHPVFGPGARGVARHHIVLTPTNKDETELAGEARKFLEDRGASVMVMTPQEHDEMMAVILGLAHFIAIVSADTLVKIDGLKKMERVSGVTFKVLLTLVESVLSEDPELYASLQMNLPHLPSIQTMFQKSSQQWAAMVKSGDREAFIKRMNELKSRLEADNPDFGKAYDNMYKLSDWL